MRIAHITATFPPYYGGTGLVCYHNARELVRRGHEVHVFTARMPGAPAEEVLEGVQVHRLQPLFRLGNAPFLPGLLRLKGFDLIHLHYPFIFGAEMIRVVSTLRRMPYVITHHNDLIGNDYRKPLFSVYRILTSNFIFRAASFTLAVTREHALNSIHANLFKSLGSKLVELSDGVDIIHFSRRTTANKKKFGLTDTGRVVLFVGALDSAHYYRRVDVLLEAFASIDKPDLWLMIAGDGNLLHQYQEMAEQLGIGERTIFLGNIPHEQLPEIYSLADVAVLPSSIQESFGLVLVEALACGAPVVASNLPGVRTVVADGVDGCLVKPGDAHDLADKLRQMLELPAAERQAMGAAGRRKVEEKYTWALAGERLEAIYQQVLSETPQAQVAGEKRTQ